MSEPVDLVQHAEALVKNLQETGVTREVYPALREFGAGLTLSEAVSIIEGQSSRPNSIPYASGVGDEWADLLRDEMRVLVRRAKLLGFGAG